MIFIEIYSIEDQISIKAGNGLVPKLTIISLLTENKSMISVY